MGSHTDLVWNFTTEYTKYMTIYSNWSCNDGNMYKSVLVVISIYINSLEIVEINFKLYTM